MARPRNPFKDLRELAAQRQALADQEKELLGTLEQMLQPFGYRVVPVTNPSARPRRSRRWSDSRRRTSEEPTEPRGSARERTANRRKRKA